MPASGEEGPARKKPYPLLSGNNRCLLRKPVGDINLAGFRDPAKDHRRQQMSGDFHLADHAQLWPVRVGVLIIRAAECSIIFRRVRRSPQRPVHRHQREAVPVDGGFFRTRAGGSFQRPGGRPQLTAADVPGRRRCVRR